MLSRIKVVSIGALCALMVSGMATTAQASVQPQTGTAVANNSIKSKHIKNGTIKKRDMNKKLYDRLLNDDSNTDNDDVTVNAPKGDTGARGPVGPQGAMGPVGPQGPAGENGVSGYEVFTSVQDFGPGGIGGSWCGAPDANASDQGWRVVGGGAQLNADDVNAGVAVVSSWPNLADPNNPGWNVQLNKPINVNPGSVTLYAVCVKE